MSQNPQDSNFYDYNPEYGNLNQQNAQNVQYGQPMMVPVGIVQKTPEQLAGEKAAQTPWCWALSAWSATSSSAGGRSVCPP